MTVYQIWGSFVKGDRDREHPTTVSMFEKDQLMGDREKTMLEFEQEFSTLEGEDLVLLKEFQPAPEVWLTKDAELEVARQIFDTFMDGWWRMTADDRGRHDRSSDEQEPAGPSLDV